MQPKKTMDKMIKDVVKIYVILTRVCLCGLINFRILDHLFLTISDYYFFHS